MNGKCYGSRACEAEALLERSRGVASTASFHSHPFANLFFLFTKAFLAFSFNMFVRDENKFQGLLIFSWTSPGVSRNLREAFRNLYKSRSQDVTIALR